MSVIVFAATQVLPGDTASAVLGKSATPERLAALREQMGLDQPMLSQYWDWISGVVRGDLGTSLTASQPVAELLSGRFVNSMALVIVAAVFSIPISLLLGSYTGAKRDSIFDHVSSIVGVVIASLPEFVIGIFLIFLLATGPLHVLPPVSQVDDGRAIWTQLDQLILPALVLAAAIVPYVMRILRSSVIEVNESEYIQLARLKGLSDRRILYRHVLPNALVPTIQVIAMCLAWLAGGIVVVEYLFNYPGIGGSLVDAVQNRDVPVVQAIVLVVTAFYLLCNLVADIVTILVSPKLRTAMR
jgi:peptide/nickel transport system permease protein